MLADAAVIAFTATTKPDQALAFYRDRLGLTLIEDSEFALIFRTGGILLRVERVAAFDPHPFPALGWEVAELRATIAELAGRGVNVERDLFVELDSDGIWWKPNGDGVAWFRDPDGNTLSLTQFASRRG
jgi:catechol 2,3-dioxygenase-like lactoylglutathione lyase family enzyme